MDNDLMARRLRPPSEPVSSFPPAASTPIPTWIQQAEAPAPPPPAAREEAPWDRPDDYESRTDSATAGEPAWDRPDVQAWDGDPLYDDRPPEMFEPEPEVYGASVVAATTPFYATEPVVAVSAAPAFSPTRDESMNDPDDAFAPVLDEVSAVAANAWPGANEQFGASEQTVPSDQPMATNEVTAVQKHEPNGGDFWADAWQSGPAGPAQPQTSSFTPVEPSEFAGRGLGPTPPAELFAAPPSIFAPTRAAEAPTAPEPETAEAPPTRMAESEYESDEVAELAVTPEQTWDAFEAFSAQEPISEPAREPASEAAESAAVFEIEVPPAAIAGNAERGAPQQLILRIELAIVDRSGRPVDPGDVSVRVSSPEPEGLSSSAVSPADEATTAPQAAVEPELDATAVENQPSWPSEVWHPDTQSWHDEPTPPQPAPQAWLEPGQQAPGAEARDWSVDPGARTAQPQVEFIAPHAAPVAPPAPAMPPTLPWPDDRPTNDPLSSLSAPPPPVAYPPPPPMNRASYAQPSFAPPPYTPSRSHVGEMSATAIPSTSDQTTTPAAREDQSGTQFRGPPPSESADGAGVPSSVSTGSRTALWTLGVGVLVVALVLVFLRLMTNVI